VESDRQPDFGPDGRPALQLRSSLFRKEREAVWHELALLVGRVEAAGLKALSTSELARLPLLYRAVLSALSVARSVTLDRSLIRYLESLALRSFICVYAVQGNNSRELSFLLYRRLPQSLFAVRYHIVIAGLALLLGILSGYLLVRQDEAWIAVLVPHEFAKRLTAASTAADLAAVLFAPPAGFLDMVNDAANTFFAHNALVTVLCMGLGMLAGAPVIILLVVQGIAIGALLALHHNRGLGLDFVAWLSVHGALEIAALLLAAGVGLKLGEAILFPGPMNRIDNIAAHARQIESLVLVTLVLLLAAAVMEGFVRQSVQSTSARLLVGAGTVLAMVFYVVSARRSGGRDGII
jgi:uncharacterized membrane protein SpoIIM required for sporulation